MKNLIVYTLCVSILGCMPAIRYDKNQICAIEDMKPIGVSIGEGTGYGYNSYQVTYSAVTSSYTVSCRLPEKPDESCHIGVLKESIVPEYEYNKDLAAKQSVTAWGYFFGIIPGLVLSAVYSADREDAITKTAEIYKKISPRCDPSPSPINSPESARAPSSEKQKTRWSLFEGTVNDN